MDGSLVVWNTEPRPTTHTSDQEKHYTRLRQRGFPLSFSSFFIPENEGKRGEERIERKQWRGKKTGKSCRVNDSFNGLRKKTGGGNGERRGKTKRGDGTRKRTLAKLLIKKSVTEEKFGGMYQLTISFFITYFIKSIVNLTSMNDRSIVSFCVHLVLPFLMSSDSILVYERSFLPYSIFHS